MSRADTREVGNKECSVSSTESEAHFVDPVQDYLRACATAEIGPPYSRGGSRCASVPPPWHLFQYCCVPRCCRCCFSGSSDVSTPRVSPTRYSPPSHDTSLLGGGARSNDSGNAAYHDEPEDIATRMRTSGKATMLVTAFFVAVAQWSALASGVRFFEDLVGLDERASAAASSAALALCFLSSIAGGILGDARWGNLRTLFTGLVCALVASTVMAVVSFPEIGWISHTGGQVVMLVALMLFAVSIGLCQTAIPNLVGDQCHLDPTRLQRYYNVYYGLIQCGAFIARIVFPLIHKELDWFISISVCMTAPVALALLVFTMNSSILSHRLPTKQIHAWRAFVILLLRIFRCQDRETLEVQYGDEAVQDSFRASAVLKLHVPLPIFWALYFQMFQLWYLQARELDLKMFGSVTIAAEQATALNPLFDVVMLIAFTHAFEALRRVRGVFLRGCTRILIGYLFAVASFAYGIWLQVRVTQQPTGTVSVWLQLPQYLFLCSAEVLVYPAALHEVYLNSPPSIRAFVQSCLWFFIGVGNTINVVVLSSDGALGGTDAKDGADLTPLFIGYTAGMCAALILYIFLMRTYQLQMNVFREVRGGSSTAYEAKTHSEPSDTAVRFSSNDESSRLLIADQAKAATAPSQPVPPVRPLAAQPERRIPISPRTPTATNSGTVYHSTRKSPRGSLLVSDPS